MTEDEFEHLLLAQFFFAAGLIGFVGLLPIGRDLLNLLAAHPGLAPWFSGTATMLGVFAALHNTNRQLKQALAKQAEDDIKTARAEKNSAEAKRNAAAQVIGLIYFAADSSLKSRQGVMPHHGMHLEWQNYIRLRKRLESFPIFEFAEPHQVALWHHIESQVCFIERRYEKATARWESLSTVEEIDQCGIMATYVKAIIELTPPLMNTCKDFWKAIGTTDFDVHGPPRP